MRPPSNARVVRARLLLVLATLAGGLVAAEIGARLLWDGVFLRPRRFEHWASDATAFHRPSRVPGLSYELRPSIAGPWGGVHVRTNALGLRGPEAREGHGPRVVVLGDSIAFGLTLAEEETWPRRLESELASGADAEVLDFAVAGYGVHEYAAVLEGRALSLAPRAVVVSYCLNDPQDEPIDGLHAFFDPTEAWQHSALARLVAWRRYQTRLASFGGGDLVRYYHAPGSPAWASARDALERMHRACAERGIAFLVVVHPYLPASGGWDAYPWRDAHAELRALGAEHGFAVLDLLPEFIASGLAPRELAVDLIHPNARGHEIAARAVARVLETELEPQKTARADGDVSPREPSGTR